ALFDAHEKIVIALLERRFIAARKFLGGLLHALQDFYAHSNYVELNYGDRLEDILGTQRNVFSFDSYPEIAGAHEAACKSGDTAETRGFELLEHFQHANPGVPQADDRLTSGIWVGTNQKSRTAVVLNGLQVDFNPDPITITQDHKCRHGMNFMQYTV